MAELRIIGWKRELKKVSLDLYVRDHTTLSLREAKDSVDDIVGGKEFTFGELDTDNAELMRRELEALGAVCRID
jgi:ribosomal protein L7/L12